MITVAGKKLSKDQYWISAEMACSINLPNLWTEYERCRLWRASNESRSCTSERQDPPQQLKSRSESCVNHPWNTAARPRVLDTSYLAETIAYRYQLLVTMLILTSASTSLTAIHCKLWLVFKLTFGSNLPFFERHVQDFSIIFFSHFPTVWNGLICFSDYVKESRYLGHHTLTR